IIYRCRLSFPTRRSSDLDDFLNEVKGVSAIDISDFEREWLRQSAFKGEEAYQSLLKSEFIKKYFEVSALRATPLKDKKLQLKTADRKSTRLNSSHVKISY